MHAPTNKALKYNIRSFLGMVLLLTALVGCKEEMVLAGVKGYDHIPWGTGAVSGFAVNGYSFEVGGHQCCVNIPRKWRSGMKAKIDWEVYLPRPGEPGENEPQHYSEPVDIPRYMPDDQLHVHFYPGHKIKIVMSQYGIKNPFYPMTKEEQLPFKADIFIIDRIKYEPHIFAKDATDKDWEWAKQWGLDKAELFANAKEQ
jgi:hypothetical protein